jgi:uncharacterized protein (UPF0548 family)
VGSGRAAFDRAVAALRGWRMHRDAGLRPRADPGGPVPGAVVVLRPGWGPVRLTAACRVVYQVEEPDRYGFAYGTLPGHPERGEELFVLRLTPAGEVRLTIRAFSRPASWPARLGGPVTHLLQGWVLRRYVRAVRRSAAGRG